MGKKKTKAKAKATKHDAHDEGFEMHASLEDFSATLAKVQKEFDHIDRTHTKPTVTKHTREMDAKTHDNTTKAGETDCHNLTLVRLAPPHIKKVLEEFFFERYMDTEKIILDVFHEDLDWHLKVPVPEDYEEEVVIDMLHYLSRVSRGRWLKGTEAGAIDILCS